MTTPSPPQTDAEWLSWLRLIRSRRVGTSTFYRLMAEYGSADAALDALPKIAADAGVEDYAPCPLEASEAEWTAAHRAGATPLAIGVPTYPPRLAETDDAPPFLWAIGETSLPSKPTIAIVGARNASSIGTRMTRRLVSDLVDSGFCIISGLARGIDTAAHLASLDSGTVAVLAGGVDVIYPAENAVLGQEIGEKGLRLSERPLGLVPRAQDFPRRNRIISGAADAVIVIEAAAQSGSLITARAALDQGREVFAVPGHPFDARAAGCNMLIRDGAPLIRGANDVLDALDRPRLPLLPPKTPNTSSARPKKAPPPPQDTQAQHAEILNRLGPSPVSEDQLIRDSGLPAQDAARVISLLELDGRLNRDAGGLLTRVD